jgi:hypothetical protein
MRSSRFCRFLHAGGNLLRTLGRLVRRLKDWRAELSCGERGVAISEKAHPCSGQNKLAGLPLDIEPTPKFPKTFGPVRESC